MVNAFGKAILSIIRRFKWLFLAMMTVTALGSSLLIGLQGASQSLLDTYENYYSEYCYQDGTINVDLLLTQPASISDIESIDGVKSAEARLVVPYIANVEDGSSVYGQVFLIPEHNFQKFYVYEEDESITGIYVNQKFAEYNHITIGENKFTLNLGGFTALLNVQAIVTSPECLYMRPESNSWGYDRSYGFIFAPQKYVEEILTNYLESDLSGIVDPDNIPYNQVIYLTEDGYDNEAVAQEIIAKIGETNVTSHSTYETSNVKLLMDSNVKPVNTVATWLPTFFFLSASLILILFLSQIIRQYRKEIGIFSALGYTKWQIFWILSIIVLGMTLFASLFAGVIGYGLSNITYSLFMGSVSLPPIGTATVSMGVCFIALGVSALVGQIAVVISGSSVFSISPSEIMSARSASERKIKPTPKYLEKCSPLTKVSYTSTMRAKKRFLLSAVCLTASLTLIATAVCFHYSKDKILSELFDVRLVHDCEIIYNQAPSAETFSSIENTEGVTKAEQYSYLTATIAKGEKKEDIVLNGVPEQYELINIPKAGGGTISSVDGLVLESHTANRLGAHIGDEVTLNGTTFTVTALSNQNVLRISYIPIASSNSVASSYIGIILVNTTDRDTLQTQASTDDYYIGITFLADLKKNSTKDFAILDVGVSIVIGFALAMALVIVFNMEQTNLLEEERNLAVMRILGFQINQLSLSWYMQLVIQLIMACIVGLPLGGLTAWWVLQIMGTPLRTYPMVNLLLPFVISVAVVWFFATVSHFICMRQIKKWDLARKTKSPL